MQAKPFDQSLAPVVIADVPLGMLKKNAKVTGKTSWNGSNQISFQRDGGTPQTVTFGGTNTAPPGPFNTVEADGFPANCNSVSTNQGEVRLTVSFDNAFVE